MFRIVTTAAIAASLALPAIAWANHGSEKVAGLNGTSSELAVSACAPGDLTVRRLSDPDCLSLIAVPTSRPDPSVELAAVPDVAPSAATRTFDYIEIAASGQSEARRIRLVGPRFLPARDESLDLKRQVTVGSDPLNAMFQGVVSALGLGVTPAVADEKPANAAMGKGARLSQVAELRQ